MRDKLSQQITSSAGEGGRRNYEIPNVTQAEFRQIEDRIRLTGARLDGELSVKAVATLRIFSTVQRPALDGLVLSTVRDVVGGDYMVVTR